VNSAEFIRWLKDQGATFDPGKGKGSHMKAFLNGHFSYVPTHSKEIPTGTVEAIKKQLGLKGGR